MDAAYAASRIGRHNLALERARLAADVVPERAAPQILARTLEYRIRGVGTADEARVTLAQLDRVTEEVSRDEAATIAFLRAEALEAVPEDGSGLSVLRECEEVSGPHALLALGIAERFLAAGDFEGALARFESALQGSLGDLRDRGRVALTAAETATRAGRDDVALVMLQDAAASPGWRTTALLKTAQIVLTQGDGARARGILNELASSTDGDDRARALAQLARLERDSIDPGERARSRGNVQSRDGGGRAGERARGSPRTRATGP